MSHRNHLLVIAILMLSLLSGIAVAQTTGIIKGTVKDGQTNEPLPSANVNIVGTSLGAVTDVEGRYIIRGVPAGTRNVRASYLGYQPKDVQVQVRAGAEVVQNFNLAYEGITGEGVTVTVQAEGQMQAINKQLSSMPVMNAVSAARIQELPDANAAESVSRLPGVSLVRTGGEGAKVVIRGLSPQFNQITIDGVELPSDVASGNNISSNDASNQESAGSVLGDRAAELSMISSSMLGGIEVIKAITPDMDATLIGGVVNFSMRKAAKGTISMIGGEESWLPLFELRTAGGYNALKNTYNDYKFIGSVEKRFFDQAFGVFFQASTERRNLSANELGASYNLVEKGKGDAGIPDITSMALTDVWRLRERVGGTLVLDYQHDGGEIGLMNFISSGDTRETRRGMSISRGSARGSIYYSANDISNETNVMSNLLSVKQDLSFLRADLKLSHSYSESRNPEDLFFNFYQDGAGLDNLDLSKAPPKVLFANAKPNIDIARLDNLSTSGSFQKERTLTGSLDLQTDFTVTDWIGGKLKVGGFYQYRTRDYDYNAGSGSQYYSGGGEVLNAFQRAMPWLANAPGGTGGFANWSRGDYDYGEFLSGEYSLPYKIDPDLMWQLLPIAKATTSLEGYQVNKLATVINDYDGNETKSAGYFMFTFNLGEDITILPGARYQSLRSEYSAMRGRQVPGSGLQGGDTTLSITHGYWLPMVHLRYRPLEWLQLHFAYTNTLNYPDYSSITPRYYIGTAAISYNNWRIKPARSENIDLVASLYSNEIGLLSVNGFKKRIEDLIFFSHTFISDLSAYPDLPQNMSQLFEFNTYINNPIPIDVYGIETEWQTHFWFLPEPFNGIVFNINYTHIFSEASYPRSEMIVTYDDEGNFVRTINDTSYTTRLLNQPNDILNLAIGYDYGGFSARLSLLYQDNIFKRPDFWMQNRVNSDKFHRWDLSVKQELPWLGMQVFLNLNNITGEDDIDINQKTGFIASEQRYGMSADAGIRIRF